MDRSRFTDNLGLKLGSLAVAALLWFHIATEKDTYERTLVIPIQITGVSPGKVISDPVPSTALVRFRGRGKRLLTLPFHDIKVNVDASEILVHGIRQLTRASVEYPDMSDLEVLGVIEPESVDIQLDERVTRRLPITPILRLTTAPGYTVVGGARSVPDSVDVTGPAARLARLRTVFTDTLTADRVRQAMDREVRLQVPAVFNVVLEPEVVRMDADVQQLGERTFTDIPVQVVGSPEGRYLAQPRTASVTVSGGNRLLEELARDQVRVIIDLKGATPDGLTPLTPDVRLPEAITLLRLEPALFRVTEYQD